MIGEEDVKYLYWEWGYREVCHRNKNSKGAMGFNLETFLRTSGQVSEHERAMLGGGYGPVDTGIR